MRLEGVDLVLETGAGGIGNWEFLSVTGTSAAAGAMAALNVLAPSLPGASVSIADATVLFRDGATGRVQTFNLGTTALEFSTGSTPASASAGVSVASVTDKRDDPCEKDERLRLTR
jgi:hypothetical protein